MVYPAEQKYLVGIGYTQYNTQPYLFTDLCEYLGHDVTVLVTQK